MGKHTVEGESPVSENEFILSGIQSTYGHVESVGKTGSPLSKPKYYLMTDREPVLWRNGEKNPGRGVKRTWNLMFTSTQRALMLDVVPFVEWSGELMYAARLSYSVTEPQGNRGWTARIVACIRPETGWPIHEQVEVVVKHHGGPNPRPLKRAGMTCG